MFVPGELPRVSLEVVVVDDDPQYMAALAREMKAYSSEASVQCVSSGVEALVLVGAKQPDFLVLDVHMPEMNGIEVCRRLRDSAAGKHLEIVMITGQFTEQLEQTCLDVGAKALLEKPVSAAQLLDVLRRPATPRKKSR